MIIAVVATLASCRTPAHAQHTTHAGHARVDPHALARLEQRAKQSGSDAVVIYQDGKLVAEWYFGKPQGPIEAMSATKSIVGLVIGRLVDTGKLASLDQPVCELFPEWRQGKKQKITIRQLLDHTSGLQNERRADIEIYPSPDFIKLALAAELSEDPGTAFRYNNKAVNLLAAIVKIVSGKPLDQYARDELFAPMGITDVHWASDPAGTPQVMAGLEIRAQDLARLGQMMLDGGTWHGKQILSAAWIAELTRPSPREPGYGLLWWLHQSFRAMVADDEVIARWRAGGASAEFIAKLTPLKDRVFTDRHAFFAAITGALGREQAWHDNTWRKGLPEGKSLPSPTLGYYANGYLGQYLVVIPAAGVVAVRQRRGPDDDAKVENPALSFEDFPAMVAALVP
jgi:CubicO group peptidase (beta-lactamase class C family)